MPKTPPPQLGDFNRIVTWQRLTPSQPRDEYGDKIKAGRYTDVADLWVAIRPLSGRESANADRLQIVASIALECLYPGPMKATDRFRYVDPDSGSLRYFNFVNVNNTDEHSFAMVILANEADNPPEDQA